MTSERWTTRGYLLAALTLILAACSGGGTGSGHKDSVSDGPTAGSEQEQAQISLDEAVKSVLVQETIPFRFKASSQTKGGGLRLGGTAYPGRLAWTVTGSNQLDSRYPREAFDLRSVGEDLWATDPTWRSRGSLSCFLRIHPGRLFGLSGLDAGRPRLIHLVDRLTATGPEAGRRDGIVAELALKDAVLMVPHVTDFLRGPQDREQPVRVTTLVQDKHLIEVRLDGTDLIDSVHEAGSKLWRPRRADLADSYFVLSFGGIQTTRPVSAPPPELVTDSVEKAARGECGQAG